MFEEEVVLLFQVMLCKVVARVGREVLHPFNPLLLNTTLLLRLYSLPCQREVDVHVLLLSHRSLLSYIYWGNTGRRLGQDVTWDGALGHYILLGIYLLLEGWVSLVSSTGATLAPSSIFSFSSGLDQAVKRLGLDALRD